MKSIFHVWLNQIFIKNIFIPEMYTCSHSGSSRRPTFFSDYLLHVSAVSVLYQWLLNEIIKVWSMCGLNIRCARRYRTRSRFHPLEKSWAMWYNVEMNKKMCFKNNANFNAKYVIKNIRVRLHLHTMFENSQNKTCGFKIGYKLSIRII